MNKFSKPKIRNVSYKEAFLFCKGEITISSTIADRIRRTMDDLGGVVVKDNVIYGPRIKYEPRKGGLGILIFEACDRYADRVCQIDAATGQTESFASFKTRSTRVAKELKRRGAVKGDVIMLCSPNVLDAAVVPTAALFLGAVTASVDPSMGVRDVAHLFSIARPKFGFVHENSVGLMEEVLGLHGEIECQLVVLGASTKYLRLAEFLDECDGEKSFRPLEVKGDDVSFIHFSSGTTGLPKGICVTHDSVFYNAATLVDITGPVTCVLHFTTMYWMSATVTFIQQFCSGASRLLIVGFEPESALELIAKYKVSNAFMATNFAYQITPEHLHEKDLSNLKCIIFGGAPMSPEQLLRLRAMFPPSGNITSGYGMTELSGNATLFTSDDVELSNRKPNSCGRPMPNFIFKIVDPDTQKQLGPNQSGEVRSKNISMMKGYYNADSSDAFDAEGFVKTGDLGHFDQEGCLYVYDRIKEMFKYQSWHIVPASIENVINEHPDVKEAAVFGIPKEKDGHLPAAAVVLKDNSRASAKDIVGYVAERVQDRQKLRGGVYICDELPKTPSNKLVRRKILSMILERGQALP